MPTREQLEAEARRRGLRPDGRWRDAEGDFAEVPRRADARRQGMRDIAQMPAPVRTMLGAFARDPEEPEYVFDAVVPRPQRSPIERAQILAGNIVEPIGNAYESLSKGIGSAVRDLPRNAIMAGMDANQWAGNEAQKAAQDPGAYADRLAGSAVTGWLNAPKTIGGPMLAQPVDDMIEGDARLKAGLNTGNAAEARSGARQALAGGAFTALNVLPAGAPVSRVARAGEGLPAARMPRQAAQAPGSVAYGDNALSQSVRLPTRDRLDPITQMRLDAEPIQGADDFDPFGRATPRERRFGRTGGTIPQQPEAGTPEWDAAVQAARTKRDGGMQLTRTERDLLRMEGDIQSGGAFSSVEMPGNRPGMPGVGSSSGDRSPSSRGLIKGAIKAGDELGYDRKYTRGLIKFGQEGMKPEATAARAQQQGWVGPVYRGMDSPTGETQFRPTISHAHEGQGVSTTKDPTVASEYSAAANTSPLGGETVYPLMVRGKTIDRDLFDRRVEAIVRDEGVLYKEAAKRAIDQFRAQGYTGIRSPVQSEMRVWPDADGEVRNIRSAYATFDPALKNRKDLMASRPESPKGQVGARPVREAGDPYRPVDLPSSNQPAALGIGEVRRSGPPDAQARTTSPKDIILGYVDRDSLGEIADNSGYAESGLTVLRQRLQKEAAANPAEFAAKYGVDETTARRFVSAEKLSVGERGADTSDRILDAAERLMRTGAKPTPKAISDMTGIPSGTVKVLFSHLRNPEKYGRATNGPRLDRFNALQQAVKDKYGANLWAPVGLGAGAGAMALTSEDAEAQDGYAYPEAYRPLDNNGRFATPDEIGPTQAPDELEDPEASGDNPWRPLITAGAIGIGALGGRAVGGMLGRSRALRRRDFNPDMLRRFDVGGSVAGGILGGAGAEYAQGGNPALGGIAGAGVGYLFGRGADMLGDGALPGVGASPTVRNAFGSANRNARVLAYADELDQAPPMSARMERTEQFAGGPGSPYYQPEDLPMRELDYLGPMTEDMPTRNYRRDVYEYEGPGPRTWGLGETGRGPSGGRRRSLAEREALTPDDFMIPEERKLVPPREEFKRRVVSRASTPSEDARRALSRDPIPPPAGREPQLPAPRSSKTIMVRQGNTGAPDIPVQVVTDAGDIPLIMSQNSQIKWSDGKKLARWGQDESGKVYVWPYDAGLHANVEYNLGDVVFARTGSIDDISDIPRMMRETGIEDVRGDVSKSLARQTDEVKRTARLEAERKRALTADAIRRDELGLPDPPVERPRLQGQVRNWAESRFPSNPNYNWRDYRDVQAKHLESIGKTDEAALVSNMSETRFRTYLVDVGKKTVSAPRADPVLLPNKTYPNRMTTPREDDAFAPVPGDRPAPPSPPGDVTPPPEPSATPQVTYAPMDPVPPLRARTGFEGMTPAVTSDVRPPKAPNRMRMEERKSDAARDRYLAAKGKSGAGFSDEELAEAASVVGTEVVTGKNGGVNRAATARAIRERLAAPGDKTLYARLRRAFPDKSLAVLLSAGAGAGAVSQQEDAFAPVR